MAPKGPFMTMTAKEFVEAMREEQKIVAAKLDEHSALLQQILRKQDFTNGKVKATRWIATTAITLALLSIGFLFQYMSRG